MIEAFGVEKRFGTVSALDGVSLTVPTGTVVGLLGHNGAGKTTLVNIFATLTRPTSGHARVAGHDVVREGHLVRRRIGLTGQFVAVDDQITAADNLTLIARLLGASVRAAGRRTAELLERFKLTEVAARPVRTYSGGMRRRLDLAACLVGRPEVIFLDEPTTGLDPESRMAVWDVVQSLVNDGCTVLLTTQYLEEADRLADTIVVLSSGRVVASGAPTVLKDRIGSRTVTVQVLPSDVERTTAALSRAGMRVTGDDRHLAVAVEASREVADVVRALDAAGVEAHELTFAEPTLDDVYLTLASEVA